MVQDRVFDFMSKYVELNDAEKASLAKTMEYGIFKKGTHLLHQGDVCHQCYFVIEGMIRQYELIDGEERTTDFYTEYQAAIAFESSAHQVPSRFSWVCEEDCLLVFGNGENEEAVYAANPKLEVMGRLFVNDHFAKYQDLAASFVTMTPEQRYLLLLEKRPDLVNRVPQYHLASYLGVKPESLSRIRRRIVERQRTGT